MTICGRVKHPSQRIILIKGFTSHYMWQMKPSMSDKNAEFVYVISKNEGDPLLCGGKIAFINKREARSQGTALDNTIGDKFCRMQVFTDFECLQPLVR